MRVQLLPILLAASAVVATAQPTLPRAEWGAPLVNVSQSAGQWTIAGQKHTVTLDPATLALTIKAEPATWAMLPSAAQDMRVQAGGEEFPVRLADAQDISVSPYDSGANTGLKVMLRGWKRRAQPAAPAIDFTLHLSLTLEGPDEELVFTIAAQEFDATRIRQLDWPTALDAREVDHTILNHYRGILLPRTWPEAYNPIRGDASYPKDGSEIQSDVVECWSQSWWGFQRGASAMMVIIETPDDASYQWSHPAGGPTVIGPRWRAQLGRLGYPRSGRMVFFEKGNYVDLAQRYRRHAIDTGLWVSLKEKIARAPKVADLIGSIESRVSILRDIVPESRLYKKDNPAANYSVTSFDERAKQLRALKAKGIDRLNLVLTGWPRKGYDREHPDGLPVAPAAGGWEGMKRLAQTCQELGYLFTLHDQYRDYYVEAPSYNPQFAVQEEDETSAPSIFPGTRFGSWKEGRLSFLAAWDGGKQTYLGPRFMLGHLKKNYEGLFAHGIRPGGSYLDVFGYVPPDQDFNPEHPTTRTEAKREIAKLYLWARAHLGVVGTEAGVDWTVPYSDYSSPLGPGKAGVPVPLFSLVYHDAVMTPYSPGGGEARMDRDDRPNWLYGMLNGGPPRVGLTAIDNARKNLDQMVALHKRVALLPMTHHEFLGANYRKERTTFSDGTTVTVDWDAKTAGGGSEMTPPARRLTTSMGPGSNAHHALVMKSLAATLGVSAALFATPLCAESAYRLLAASDLPALTGRLEPGDVVLLPDATWENQTLTFRGKGTAQKPITLKATNPGKFVLSEKSSLTIDGEWLVVEGVSLKGAGIEGADGIAIKGSNNRLTSSVVDGSTHKFAIHLYGTHHRVDTCYFANKTSADPTFQIEVEAKEPNYHRVDHNHFGYRQPLGRNGGETMRVGYSGQSMSNSRTTVEQNLFERCDGEIEIISSKSCENIYRGNTFRDCDGMLTLRHGNRNVVDGNFFFGGRRPNSGGIRVIGEDHVVTNNYIEGVMKGAFWITSGVPDSALNQYYQAKRALIAFNTVVDSAGPYLDLAAGLGGAGRTLKPERIVIANNVFIVGSGGKLLQGEAGDDWRWVGNIATGATIEHAGIRLTDPKLERSPDGLLRPAAHGPTRGAAEGEFALVKTDIDGQPRLGKIDSGCDQHSDAPITNRPLTAADTGPAWLKR